MICRMLVHSVYLCDYMFILFIFLQPVRLHERCLRHSRLTIYLSIQNMFSAFIGAFQSVIATSLTFLNFSLLLEYSSAHFPGICRCISPSVGIHHLPNPSFTSAMRPERWWLIPQERISTPRQTSGKIKRGYKRTAHRVR